MTDDSVREVREQVVHEHFAAENAHDSDAALATFTRPRYELIATDTVHDGPDAVAAYYQQMQDALSNLYSSIDDVDLWVGAVAEDATPGSALGELLNEMLHHEFNELMIGDRFFFMWDDELSQAEIGDVLGTRLSDVIVRNTSITNLQTNVFFVPEPSSLALCLMLFAVTALRRGRR